MSIIVPGYDYDLIEKHGDPSRPDYRAKHPNIKRPKMPGKSGNKSGSGSNNGSGGPKSTPKTGPAPKKFSGKTTGTGTKEDPIRTTDVDVAAQALIDDKFVELSQPREISVVLDRLNAMINDDKDLKKKDIDLCKVSVPKTNLFCTDAIVDAKEGKGARFYMPQLKAAPEKGTKAFGRKKNPDDPEEEVDLQPEFKQLLMDRGVKVTREKEGAAYLRPTQRFLRGGKVAGMADSIRNFRENREGRKLDPEKGAVIFVSSDNYIIDGHHRWAALVADDYKDNKAGGVDMTIDRIDMPIVELLAIANKFADDEEMPRFEKSQFSFDPFSPCGCNDWVAQRVTEMERARIERIRNR